MGFPDVQVCSELFGIVRLCSDNLEKMFPDDEFKHFLLYLGYLKHLFEMLGWLCATGKWQGARLERVGKIS